MKQTPLVALRRITADSPDDVDFIRSTRNSFIGKDIYADEHFVWPGRLAWFATLDETKDFFFAILPNERQTPVG